MRVDAFLICVEVFAFFALIRGFRKIWKIQGLLREAASLATALDEARAERDLARAERDAALAAARGAREVRGRVPALAARSLGEEGSIAHSYLAVALVLCDIVQAHAEEVVREVLRVEGAVEPGPGPGSN